MKCIDDKIYVDSINQLMTSLKEVNRDWLILRNSKKYRIGMGLVDFADDLKRFKIGRLLNVLKRRLRGKTERQRKCNSNTTDICNISNYFSNERIAIYMVIFGNYDRIIEPAFIPDNCDFYIYTDQEVPEGSIWKKGSIPPEIESLSNIEKNRFLKMMPHKLFPNYKYSIYVDGNVKIISDLTEYINLLNETGIGIHKHHVRDCIYDEMRVLTKYKKVKKKDIFDYKKKLDDEEFPKNYGLLQCNVIVREHNNPTTIKVMEDWWSLFLTYAKRDQIYLPYVLYKNDISIDKVGILGNNMYMNPSFRITNHN